MRGSPRYAEAHGVSHVLRDRSTRMCDLSFNLSRTYRMGWPKDDFKLSRRFRNHLETLGLQI